MITEGYDVVVAISEVQTNDDCPVTPIKMNSITIVGSGTTPSPVTR